MLQKDVSAGKKKKTNKQIKTRETDVAWHAAYYSSLFTNEW